MNHAILVPTLYVLAGICLPPAGIHLYIGLQRPRNAAHLAFGAMSLLMCALAWSSVQALQAPDLPQELAALRLNFAVGLLFVAALATFTALYTGERPRPLLAAFGLAVAVLLTADLLEPGSLLYAQVVALRRCTLPWNEELACVQGRINPWFYGMIALTFAVYAYALAALGRRYRRTGHPAELWILLGVVALALSGIEGALVRLQLLDFVSLGHLGYLGLVVAMSAALLYEYRLEVRRSQQRILQLFRLSPAAIVLSRVDDGCILEANDAFLALFGRERSEVMGRTSTELGMYGDAAVRAELIRRLREEGQLRDTEVEVRAGGGRSATVSISTDYVEAAEGLCILTTLLDISEIKRHERELQAAQERLRELALSLQSRLEEERVALARDIHDELGGALSGLRIALGSLSLGAAGAQPALLERLRGLERSAVRAMGIVHELCERLRPPALDDLGLAEACRYHLEQWAQMVEVAATGRFGALVPPPAAALETDLFRIFQELLTNVARHSGASEAWTSLERDEEGRLVLTVVDNGSGLPARRESDGLGLLGVRERAHKHAGSVEIESDGSGTLVRVSFPPAPA